MQTQAIALNQLHVSPLNMRAERKEPSLKKMAAIAANIIPTVRERGILTDLIVRKNNSGFVDLFGRKLREELDSYQRPDPGASA